MISRKLALIAAAILSIDSEARAQGLENRKPIVFIWSESVETGKRTPLGSGFVLSESGDVLTAKHVVEQFVDGERLVVSISTKSTFPVQVDMSDVDCDVKQDFCFIRIPSDVIADHITAFYTLGCYVPKADTPLMAAGFFAGGDTNSGVVTPRGNSIGRLIAGGLLPTSIPLEPGMSGGPVFDESLNVIGIVKGGSSQFGYVQPLQRARSSLLNRGIECIADRKPEIKQEVPVDNDFRIGKTNLLAGTDILYFRRFADDDRVITVLAENRLPYRLMKSNSSENTNVVTCTKDAPFLGVKSLALDLIDAGVELQAIAPRANQRESNKVSVERYCVYEEEPLLTPDDVLTMTVCPDWQDYLATQRCSD